MSMSILLDALKKSETQRQLGTVPTLETTAFDPDPARQQDHSWTPVAMSLAAAGVILWIGLVQFRHADSMNAQPAAGIEPGSQVPPVVASRASSGDSDVQSASTPVKNYRDTPPAAPGGVARRSAGDRGTQPVNRHDLPVKTFAREDSALPAGRQPGTESPDQLPPPGDEPGAKPGSEDVTQTESSREFNPAEANSSGKPSPVASDSDSAGDTLEPYVTEPISYWQMPQSVRDSLGELRVSVLVYSDNPQDRFLLINGQRLREQEELGDGLLLLEIQRDRAIFSYHSYRFQLKS